MNTQAALNKQISEGDGHWHKLCALLMWKLSPRSEVIVTTDEIAALEAQWQGDGGPAIFVQHAGDTLSFRLISRNAADKLARQ